MFVLYYVFYYFRFIFGILENYFGLIFQFIKIKKKKIYKNLKTANIWPNIIERYKYFIKKVRIIKINNCE